MEQARDRGGPRDHMDVPGDTAGTVEAAADEFVRFVLEYRIR